MTNNDQKKKEAKKRELAESVMIRKGISKSEAAKIAESVTHSTVNKEGV